MPKFKWPYDTTLTIAIFALLLSSAQFLLNTPIFMDFYFKPELIVTGTGSPLKSKSLTGTFVLRNDGRSAATNVELGLVLQENQRINFLPKIKANIVWTEKPVLVANVRIDIPRLNPGEEIVIVILPGENDEPLNEEIVEFISSSGINEIPFVSFLRSEQGIGNNLTGDKKI